MTTQAIYQAISDATAAISKEGIAKSRQAMGYQYRGIDQVYDCLAKILPQVGIVIIPSLKKMEMTERKSTKGAALNYVYATYDYTFFSTKDGSSVTATVTGEAMDSGDKATSKASSIAYRNACFQVFCIPLAGVDPEEDEHDVEPLPPTPDQIRAEIKQAIRAVGGKEKAVPKLAKLFEQHKIKDLVAVASIQDTDLLSEILDTLLSGESGDGKDAK